MEFPFGHNHSHTHHHRNDDEENQERPPPPHPHLHHHEFTPPYPPPPSSQQPPGFDGPYPPPPPSSYFHQPGFDGPPPPSYFQQPGFPPPPPHQPPSYQYQQPPHVTHVHHQPEHSPSNYSPPSASVSHVAHESSQGRVDAHPSFRPHLPPEFYKKPTVKIYCKADPNFHLTIRDGKVVLAPSDPSDEFQHWYKDEKFSTSVKDEVGFPSFSLVNKATGQAIKHSIGASHPALTKRLYTEEVAHRHHLSQLFVVVSVVLPIQWHIVMVQLVPYKPDHLDESVLWSESKEVRDGYRAIRMINNIRLNVDAFHGDKKSGGIQNGTTIVLWQWNKGDNQIWKIVPY
ncbi:Adenosylhomocysteinase [Gossypium arboreum]|uniref:Adenosylhomocysteinase n=1 Tax=Gossypium arboreum TaxID=29729 RepID=A0A0B0M9I0_GOSAR|nr:Adenosylhomocysteinase [Gossypium arboreum]